MAQHPIVERIREKSEQNLSRFDKLPPEEVMEILLDECSTRSSLEHKYPWDFSTTEVPLKPEVKVICNILSDPQGRQTFEYLLKEIERRIPEVSIKKIEWRLWPAALWEDNSVVPGRLELESLNNLLTKKGVKRHFDDNYSQTNLLDMKFLSTLRSKFGDGVELSPIEPLFTLIELGYGIVNLTKDEVVVALPYVFPLRIPSQMA